MPVTRLTEVFRQAAESRIFVNAHNGDLSVVSRIDIEEGELVVYFDGRAITYGLPRSSR